MTVSVRQMNLERKIPKQVHKSTSPEVVLRIMIVPNDCNKSNN